jgi:hypothetical protein
MTPHRFEQTKDGDRNPAKERARQGEPSRKSRRWVDTATALTHYSRGDIFRDYHEDTELRLANAEARQRLIGNKEARVRPIADLRRQVLNLWPATLLAEAGATAPEIAEAMTWTVDKAQKVIDLYLARRGVLAANAIQKLENYRDKAAKSGTPS